MYYHIHVCTTIYLSTVFVWDNGLTYTAGLEIDKSAFVNLWHSDAEVSAPCATIIQLTQKKAAHAHNSMTLKL
jgi:hypothetical protein